MNNYTLLVCCEGDTHKAVYMPVVCSHCGLILDRMHIHNIPENSRIREYKGYKSYNKSKSITGQDMRKRGWRDDF